MIQIPCPDCGQILNVPDEHLDKSGTCKHCKSHVVLRRPFYVAAIDLETTGLECDHHDILEVAGVLFDLVSGQVVDRFSELINPNVPISKKASEINGITKSMVEDCRKPDAVLRSFLGWLGRAEVIIAHNAPFESSFILASARRHNINLPETPFIDTLAWARDALAGSPDHKLATLMAFTGASTVGLHRASADAEGVRHIVLRMLIGVEDRKRELTRRAEKIHTCAARQGTREKPAVEIDHTFWSFIFHHTAVFLGGVWYAIKIMAELFFSKPRTWRDDPMTERQRDYLYSLGMEDCQIRAFTKGQASHMISNLTGEASREDGNREIARAIRKQTKSNSDCLTCLIIVLILLFTPVWLPILLGILAVVGLS